MGLLKYFLIVNDISTIFPDLTGLTDFENVIVLLFSNICIWFFIYIILSIIFKILVRFK